MKPKRLIQGLLVATGILVLLTAVYFYRLIPRGKIPYVKAAKQAERILLQQQGQQVELRKTLDRWSVTAGTTTLAADPSRVQTLLSSLEEVRLEDVMSYDTESAGRYDLGPDAATRVAVWARGDKLLADGSFGKQAPDYTHIYFRYAGRNEVYLAAGLFKGEVSPGRAEDWKAVEVSTPTTKPQAGSK